MATVNRLAVGSSRAHGDSSAMMTITHVIITTITTRINLMRPIAQEVNHIKVALNSKTVDSITTLDRKARPAEWSDRTHAAQMAKVREVVTVGEVVEAAIMASPNTNQVTTQISVTICKCPLEAIVKVTSKLKTKTKVAALMCRSAVTSAIQRKGTLAHSSRSKITSAKKLNSSKWTIEMRCKSLNSQPITIATSLKRVRVAVKTTVATRKGTLERAHTNTTSSTDSRVAVAAIFLAAHPHKGNLSSSITRELMVRKSEASTTRSKVVARAAAP